MYNKDKNEPIERMTIKKTQITVFFFSKQKENKQIGGRKKVYSFFISYMATLQIIDQKFLPEMRK